MVRYINTHHHNIYTRCNCCCRPFVLCLVLCCRASVALPLCRIHCFENVTAVLFVAAISEYDQVLYEDENTNRIVEALNLFEEICNSRWFRETSVILFLNKRDLFAEKCKKVSLSVCFPDYTGDDSYEAGVEYLQEQFEMKNRNSDKQVYTHVTCATDTDNIGAVFNAVKDIIIRKSLNEAGLV